MKCVEIGTIQAYIDGELDISMKKKVQKHLEECDKCGTAYIELSKTDDAVFQKLSAYKQYCDENFTPCGKFGISQAVEGEVKQRTKGKNMVLQLVRKYKKAVTAASVAVILTTCIAVQPVRAFISEALNIFRVENVKSLQISLADMEDIKKQLEQKEEEIDIKNFGKITTEGFEELKLPVQEAKTLADPTVLLPSETDGNIDINVIQSGRMSFTMNVENVNEALKSFGAEKLLPENLDGKTFTAYFAAQVEYQYHENNNDYFVMQTEAPELTVPADVNVDEMYDCLLELPILPEDIKHKLKTIQDWKNTVYLPVVGEAQEITVRGAEGFIAQKADNGWMVIWYDNGTIFSVESNAGKEDTIEFVERLR